MSPDPDAVTLQGWAVAHLRDLIARAADDDEAVRREAAFLVVGYLSGLLDATTGDTQEVAR